MWTRISHALKRGAEQDVDPSQANATNNVVEQPDTFTPFHDNDSHDYQEKFESPEVPFPTPSPPSSPSKHGRRGMFKRMSKSAKTDDPTSPILAPLKLPLQIPKKVKSHLNLHTNVNDSQTSLARAPDSATDKGRPSLDSVRTPATPIDGKFGSIRSILRDRNTPGTGQSVRFFSRDAYKVISPDVSAASEPEELPFMDRLQNLSPENSSLTRSRNRPRPAAQDLFSPPKSSTSPPETPADPTKSLTSMMMPMAPPDLSNIFDLSQRDLPAIPPNTGASLLDNAVEMFEGDESRDDLTASNNRDSGSIPPTPPPKTEDTTVFHSMEKSSGHDRSQSFSFGQTVFRALPKSTPPLSSTPVDSDKLAGGLPIDIARPPSRNRAMSDTIFHSMIRSSRPPEADINDVSGSSLVFYTPAPEKERERPPPDPFSANATTYYTPGTMIPPTPPQSTHTRKASREEDMIWSLRTQLTLQQELCAQYEIDLSARDELVNSLTTRLETTEKECEKRKSVVRGWKKKVLELEKLCRHLENEADNSRQESFERSIMDEASGEALRQLHRQIAALEREKNEVAKREQEMREAKEKAEGWVKEREEEISKLKHELSTSQGETSRSVLEGVPESMKDENDSTLSKQLEEAESKWDVERGHLLTDIDTLREAKNELMISLEETKAALTKKEDEMAVLKGELEAQWRHTEENGDKFAELKQERDTLQNELVALEAKVESMEVEWNESENRKVELENEVQEAWAVRDELEREKEQLEEELRAEQEHADQLTQGLQEREDRITSLQQELKYANDNAYRLEQQVQDRNAEVERLAHQVVAREDEAEEARSELKSLDRKHSHALDEQRRAVADLTARESEARSQLEAAVKDKAEADVAVQTLRDRVHLLEGEVEKLRKQVHDLQAQSSDKDMRIVHMEKQRKKDLEDIEGLNIALDSKQQELELIKRRTSTKGTAGATPATSKIMSHRRESSTAFVTPSVSRPASRLSDASKDGKLSDTPSTVSKPTTLGKSIRTNGSASSTPAGSSATGAKIAGSMGPPPSSMKPRPSMSTPTTSHTRIPSISMARSMATKTPASVTPKVSSLRRTSSATAAEITRATRLSGPPSRGPTSPVLSETDEKENTQPGLKRRSLVAA